MNERLLEICEVDRPKVAAIVEEEVTTALESAKKPKKKRLPKEGEEDWVSFKSLFGTTKIPLAVAEMVADVIGRLTINGDIGEANKWQSLEWMAAEWLGGPSASRATPPSEV